MTDPSEVQLGHEYRSILADLYIAARKGGKAKPLLTEAGNKLLALLHPTTSSDKSKTGHLAQPFQPEPKDCTKDCVAKPHWCTAHDNYAKIHHSDDHSGKGMTAEEFARRLVAELHITAEQAQAIDAEAKETLSNGTTPQSPTTHDVNNGSVDDKAGDKAIGMMVVHGMVSHPVWQGCETCRLAKVEAEKALAMGELDDIIAPDQPSERIAPDVKQVERGNENPRPTYIPLPVEDEFGNAAAPSKTSDELDKLSTFAFQRDAALGRYLDHQDWQKLRVELEEAHNSATTSLIESAARQREIEVYEWLAQYLKFRPNADRQVITRVLEYQISTLRREETTG